MATRPLDDFFAAAKVTEEHPRVPPSPEGKSPQGRGTLFQPEGPQELPPSYLVSATYDGSKGAACVKLYEPESERIYVWHDNTGHRPYCLTNLTSDKLEKIDRLVSHPGFDHLEPVEKYDPLLDRKVTLTKVVAKDPLAIGGRPAGCIRDIIPREYTEAVEGERGAEVWEAFIKYYQSYIYDRDLDLGMIYRIQDGGLVSVRYGPGEEMVNRIRGLFRDQPEETLWYIERWARLLECPVPRFRRVALDIEVFSPIATRVPDASQAAHPIICVSLLGSDGSKRVLLLRRKGVKEGSERLPSDVRVEYYDSEKDLVQEVFEAIDDYPFVVTFNGDDFDLRYLWRRAQNLGFRRDQIPIEAARLACLLRYGIHIDLYKFFFNRSIQVYAFGKKYGGVTLNEVGQALIELSKLDTRPVSELSYTELARYCFRDAEITHGLSAFDDDLVMKLILVLARVSRMPMEDVSRQGVSRWIRSFLQGEHRRRGWLIPNKEDIEAVKGKTATKAIIKGKKYKGAVVVEPTPGVHFNVAVMDFSSLYPSIIKVHNLGYQSINCSHEECKANRVPDTPHWICTKHRALESLLIGGLRDLRVEWYKPKSKDKTVSRELRGWYNVIQSALKVILNASYGVFGAEAFDLYCPPVAEATAAIGRHAITRTIKTAQELGIEVIYGDTDSVFLKSPSPRQVETLAEWSEKDLGMELDLDKSYRYSVFSSRKKNYLGVFPDGTPDVKGLTGKKSNVPEFLKKAFEHTVNRLGEVKSPADFDDAKKEIRRIVRDCYLKLKRREYSLEDLAFKVVLGKIPAGYTKTTPQHVKAAKLLMEKGVEIKAGDEIQFVKVLREPHVKPAQLASPSEVDVDKYVGYIRSTFDQVLEPLDLDFNEIIGLTKLERFM